MPRQSQDGEHVEPPPTYEEALELQSQPPHGDARVAGNDEAADHGIAEPDAGAAAVAVAVDPSASSSSPVAAGAAPQRRSRGHSESFRERERRLSIKERDNECEDDAQAHGNDQDEEETYSLDDEAFERYDDDDTTTNEQAAESAGVPLTPPQQQQLNDRDRDVAVASQQPLHQAAIVSGAGPGTETGTEPAATAATPRPRRHSSGRGSSSAAPPSSNSSSHSLVYDDQTYSIVSKLRLLNRQFASKIDSQTRQIQLLQAEKKKQLTTIQTLESDLRMVKQTLRQYQNLSPKTTHAVPARTSSATSSTVQQQQQQADDWLPPVGSPPQSPRASSSGGGTVVTRPAATRSAQPSPCKTDGSPRSLMAPSPRRALHTASSSGGSSGPTAAPSTSEKLLVAKIEKLEQDKRDLASRHAHQLANYSHELSRLERHIEHAQTQVQAKDYELRLQKSRQLYTIPSHHHHHRGSGGDASSLSLPASSSSAVSSSSSSSSSNRHHQFASLLCDSLWKELLPSTPPASTNLALPFTSHVGLAFEQLLGHQLLSFHDHMVDATTRDWLHEIRKCGTHVLQLHHTFQCMARTFKALSQCTHLYELAETFTKEAQQLTTAEQVFLFVMDPAENEFWCRIPRPSSSSNTSSESSTTISTENINTSTNSTTSASSTTFGDMITVRSRVMPVSGHGGVSAVAAEHTGAGGTAGAMANAMGQLSAIVPCGLASWVFSTKKPLLIPAGYVTKNAHFSIAPDNTDRLMHLKSASTLLMPILQGNTCLGVIQVCGKLTHLQALGVSISLEKCDAFTSEDQVVLTMLSHFMSGVLPKTAYFTEVESNKINEETLIQLAPEIFTCLRFDELGKMVIQNAKEILDADRCSLFVADNEDKMLFNWQSDISGKGGVEVINDVKKSTMRIPFGHGMVGMVAETLKSINIPDAYEDSRFNSSWDKKTNYRTKSILTVPILTTVSTKMTKNQKQKPVAIRKRRSQHDVYGNVIMDSSTTISSSNTSPSSNTSGDHHQDQEQQPPEPKQTQTQTLLGVVQVINKSGGAPFRSKDEFLLQTISKLIALAIENSQLFQKTQELCGNLGKLIAKADLVEAICTLGAAAEDIIGVESAAVYVVVPGAPPPASSGGGAPQRGPAEEPLPDLVTFHRKRRHKITIKAAMYRHSLLARAMETHQIVIVNEVCAKTTPSFNAYVDSIGGLPARNVLFLPLLIDDPEETNHAAGETISKKCIGVLHLVNTRGRKLVFDQFDLFLSIVGSQTCSVLASILEKQQILRHQQQTTHLLDTTMGFFKEMSPVGIINAVYNTCSSLFSVEKAHLFLWEPDHRAMWTAKLSPNAETVSFAIHSASSAAAAVSGSGSASEGSDSHLIPGAGRAPSLRSQSRRISVLTDKKIRVPTSEGLLEHVLSKSALVVVKQWVAALDEDEDQDHDQDESEMDSEMESDQRQDKSMVPAAAASGAGAMTAAGSRYTLRACRSDAKAGFTKFSVVACPVWDLDGVEIIGIVVLFFPKGKPPAPSELGNLPILSRQISGALNVCGDLRAVTQRCERLQEIVHVYAPPPIQMARPLPLRGLACQRLPAMSLTLSARGQLCAFSQPLNVGTSGFSVPALLQFAPPCFSGYALTSITTSGGGSNTSATTSSSAHVDTLAMDEDGNRWVFQLTGKTLNEMVSTHFVNWIGHDLPSLTTGVLDKLRTDLQCVYATKETITGLATEPMLPLMDQQQASQKSLLPPAVARKMRLLLWEFVDLNHWQIDFKRAFKLFGSSHQISREQLEVALTTNGRDMELDQVEWDLLHAQFANPETNLIQVNEMVKVLAPQFQTIPTFTYELNPILDSITQTVVNVHVILTAAAPQSVVAVV